MLLGVVQQEANDKLHIRQCFGSLLVLPWTLGMTPSLLNALKRFLSRFSPMPCRNLKVSLQMTLPWCTYELYILWRSCGVLLVRLVLVLVKA